MSDDLQEFVTDFGVPQQPEEVPSDVIVHFTTKLPPSLIRFWTHHGVGMWGGGKVQFCRPDRYAGLVNEILSGDPDFHPDRTHLYAFGVFGELLLWNEQHEIVRVELPYLVATADRTRPSVKQIDPDISIASPLMDLEDERNFSLWSNDPTPVPIFKACLKRLGPLQLGECFGLFPALALGGSVSVESVKKVKALEHFSLLAQLGPIRLCDYADGRERFVRHLGSG